MEGFLVHTCLTVHQHSFWILVECLRRTIPGLATHPLPEADFSEVKKRMRVWWSVLVILTLTIWEGGQKGLQRLSFKNQTRKRARYGYCLGMLRAH